MEQLDSVLSKLPGIPCIAVIRDPRGVCGSRVKRGQSYTGTCRHINGYIRGFRKAVKNGHNILAIQYEDLCTNSEKVIKQMFNFLNLPYNENWKTMATAHNNHRGQISTDCMKEYPKHLSEAQCQDILKRTKDWSEFHWNF